MKLRTTLQRVSTQRRLAAGISAAILLAGVLNANVFAASNKPYSVTVPTIVGPSTTTISVTDQANQQQLGSMEIQLPPGFGFMQDSGGNYGTVTDPDEAPGSVMFTLLSTNPALLEIQNLNLQPGHTAQINLTGVSIPSGSCSMLQWTFTAQQANQWNSGNGANYLTLSNTVPNSYTCQLVFTSQPADAGQNQDITSVALTEAGAPVAVQVQDAGGNVVSSVATSITLSLNLVYPTTNSGAALTGTTTASATQGTAAFSPLYINNSGRYSLTATPSNGSIAPATSNAFRIWDGAAACGSSGCAVPLSSGGEQVNVSSTSSQGAIGASLDIVTFDCSASQYGGVAAITGTHTTAWTSYDLNAEKTTTLFIPQTILQNATDPLLEAHYMVCMSAPYQFPVAWTPSGPSSQLAQPDPTVSQAMTGTSTGWFRGLLPDCQDLTAQGYASVPASHAPCVSSRVFGTNSALVAGLTVTILAASGDPMGR